jgi:hypothetical protein
MRVHGLEEGFAIQQLQPVGPETVAKCGVVLLQSFRGKKFTTARDGI